MSKIKYVLAVWVVLLLGYLPQVVACICCCHIFHSITHAVTHVANSVAHVVTHPKSIVHAVVKTTERVGHDIAHPKSALHDLTDLAVRAEQTAVHTAAGLATATLADAPLGKIGLGHVGQALQEGITMADGLNEVAGSKLGVKMSYIPAGMQAPSDEGDSQQPAQAPSSDQYAQQKADAEATLEQLLPMSIKEGAQVVDTQILQQTVSDGVSGPIMVAIMIIVARDDMLKNPAEKEGYEKFLSMLAYDGTEDDPQSSIQTPKNEQYMKEVLKALAKISPDLAVAVTQYLKEHHPRNPDYTQENHEAHTYDGQAEPPAEEGPMQEASAPQDDPQDAAPQDEDYSDAPAENNAPEQGYDDQQQDGPAQENPEPGYGGEEESMNDQPPMDNEQDGFEADPNQDQNQDQGADQGSPLMEEQQQYQQEAPMDNGDQDQDGFADAPQQDDGYGPPADGPQEGPMEEGPQDGPMEEPQMNAEPGFGEEGPIQQQGGEYNDQPPEQEILPPQEFASEQGGFEQQSMEQYPSPLEL